MLFVTVDAVGRVKKEFTLFFSVEKRKGDGRGEVEREKEIESALLHSVITTAAPGSFHRCRSSSPFQLPLRDAVISTLSLHML